MSTSNSFKLLSKNSGNTPEANGVLSTEIHNTAKDTNTNNANKAPSKIRESKMIKTKL